MNQEHFGLFSHSQIFRIVEVFCCERSIVCIIQFGNGNVFISVAEDVSNELQGILLQPGRGPALGGRLRRHRS